MSSAASRRPLRPSCIALLLFISMLTSTTLRRVGANPLGASTLPSNNSLWDFTLQSDNLTTASSSGMEYSTDSTTEYSTKSSTEYSTDSSTENSTVIAPNTDVYVIKAIVYEIGILTDADNTTSSESSETSESTERQESVDISVYSAPQEDKFV